MNLSLECDCETSFDVEADTTRTADIQCRCPSCGRTYMIAVTAMSHSKSDD